MVAAVTSGSAGRIASALGQWSGGEGPLYARLASALRALLQRGGLAAGDRLPPERLLARALAVSRTTVVAAYDLLRAEGLLDSRVGSGTWVRGATRASVEPAGEWAAVASPSPLVRSLIEQVPGTVKFLCAHPYGTEVLPPEALSLSSETLMRGAPPSGYDVLGLRALREAVADWFGRHALPTSPDQILITAGAQQAISLLVSVLVRPGQVALVEDPTYPGALDAMAAAGARVGALPLDDAGVRTDALRDALASAPALAYVVPTFHNPTGLVLGEARRREIARIAEDSRVPVVEDLTLTDVSFGDDPPPPIAAFARAAPVFTIGSTSKLFWGGLRVGWIRASQGAIERLARAKAVADLGTSVISQLVALQLLEHADVVKQRRREEFAPRLALLEQLLAERLPGWHWRTPAGGLTLWVRLPIGDANEFAQVALRRGVEVIPGSTMSGSGGFRDHLRLTFVLAPAEIREGVERLAAAWREYEPLATRRSPGVNVLV